MAGLAAGPHHSGLTLRAAYPASRWGLPGSTPPCQVPVVESTRSRTKEAARALAQGGRRPRGGGAEEDFQWHRGESEEHQHQEGVGPAKGIERYIAAFVGQTLVVGGQAHRFELE